MKNILTLFICIIFSIGFTEAQVQEQLSPEERKQLTKITEPVTLYKGFFRSRISSFYFSVDKSFDKDGNRVAYPSVAGSGFGVNMIFQYGITDRLEAEVLLPYQSSSVEGVFFYQIPFTGEVGVERTKNETNGIGDMAASIKYQLVQDKPGTPAVVLGLTGYIPTGKSDPSNIKGLSDFNGPTGKGEFGLAPEIRIRKIAYPFSFEFGAAYITYFGTKKLLEPNAPKVKVTSGAEFLIRPQINFHLNEWVSITNYVDYYGALKDSFKGVDYFGSLNNEYEQWTIRYYPGITFQIKKLRLEQAVLIPLFGKIIPADPMFFFGLDYMF